MFDNLIWQMPPSSESKSCFNILCNYTMTHYTILTIKQQILIVKLQFIYGVNGDGSKTAKIIKKVILLSITLTFRRCDGSNDADSCNDVQ